MAMRVTTWLSRTSLLRAFVALLRLAVRLLRDPIVPLLPKVLPVAAALYVISPLDLIPDVVPVLGQLDDLGILLIALEGFVRWCPAEAVDFHRTAIAQGRRYAPMPSAGEVIDAEFRREDRVR
jgi:uncharacterized membrane protein YkvA (DUF1232 family)